MACTRMVDGRVPSAEYPLCHYIAHSALAASWSCYDLIGIARAHYLFHFPLSVLEYVMKRARVAMVQNHGELP